MSKLEADSSGLEDELVLVFRPPENPAAQVAASTPFKGHRVRLDELLDWFKALKVDSIELWIEGARTSGRNTELFLSTEGKGAKITLKPHFDLTTKLSSAAETMPSSTQNAIGDQASETSETISTKNVENVTDSSLVAFFSPRGGIEQQILTRIGEAAESIEMAAYAFTNSKIANSLVDAAKRGIKISIVMDKSQTKGVQASMHDQLEKAGIAIRLISPPGGIMHDKFIIVDSKNVEWGSYNYTDRAENSNFENATFLPDSATAQKYHTDFASIFTQATPEIQGISRPLRRFWRRLKSPFRHRG